MAREDNTVDGGGEAGDPGVSRFSVSLPRQLLEDLDLMVAARGYDSRSRALADLIRDGLVDYWQQFDAREIAGTVTLVYDHHRRNVQQVLTEIQHEHLRLIVSSLHVHLDHDNCLEVIVVRGKAKAVKALADALAAADGVKHGKLTVTSTGRDLPP